MNDFHLTTYKYNKKKQPDYSDCFSICRDDPTRTDDPYVPNVVR